MPGFLEFFCGGGMVRAGLGPAWRCLLANDLDPKKCAAYAENFGDDRLIAGDIAALSAEEVPGGADLAWASFPCQDLSLAGARAGLAGGRSATYWAFHRLIAELRARDAAPRIIALENVCGLLTSRGGRDFGALTDSLDDLGYRVGALTIDAAAFLPQSRPRLFVIAMDEGIAPPASAPQADMPMLETAWAAASARARDRRVYWPRPQPARPRSDLVDLIDPRADAWRSQEETARLLGRMTAMHRSRVEAARADGGAHAFTVFNRMRPDGRGGSVQRAEARFDGLAGCLRTPAGGSSRQTLLWVAEGRARSRLLSPREAARLMGLPDGYRLPERPNDAYRLLGDGVAVPVIRRLAETIFEPALAGRRIAAAA